MEDWIVRSRRWWYIYTTEHSPDFTSSATLQPSQRAHFWEEWWPVLPTPNGFIAYQVSVLFPDGTYSDFEVYYDPINGSRVYSYTVSDVTMVGNEVTTTFNTTTGASLTNIYNWTLNVMQDAGVAAHFTQSRPRAETVFWEPIATFLSPDGTPQFNLLLSLVQDVEPGLTGGRDITVWFNVEQYMNVWLAYLQASVSGYAQVSLVSHEAVILASTIPGTDPRRFCFVDPTAVQGFTCNAPPANLTPDALTRTAYLAVADATWATTSVPSGHTQAIITVAGSTYYAIGEPIFYSAGTVKVNAVWTQPTAQARGSVTAAIGGAIGALCATLILSTVLLVAAIHVMLLQPIKDISADMEHVATLDLAAMEADASGTGRGKASGGLYSVVRLREAVELTERFELMKKAISSFVRYVPVTVVKELLVNSPGQGVAQLGMSPAMAAVMFVDIAGFTTLCEAIPVEELCTVLHMFFGCATRCFMYHNATVDKFIGDCIMSLWGVPCALLTPNTDALLSAIHVAALTQQLDLPKGVEIKLRIGVNSGDVLAGNMGCDERMSYTAIGDVVNTASRLEGINKKFNTTVMASRAVMEGAAEENYADAFVTRAVGCIRVVGREEPVVVYDVMGLTDADVNTPQCLSVDPPVSASPASRNLSVGASARSVSSSTKNPRAKYHKGEAAAPRAVVWKLGALDAAQRLPVVRKEAQRWTCSRHDVAVARAFTSCVECMADRRPSDALAMFQDLLVQHPHPNTRVERTVMRDAEQHSTELALIVPTLARQDDYDPVFAMDSK